MNSSIELNSIKFSEQSNVAKYLKNIKQFPILSAEEEYNLTKEYFTSKDAKIANKIITSHLRLIVKVVKGYRGYGLPTDEMMSEGSIGLLVALNKFNPNKGFRFSTYAIWWIKAYVQKYILNSWSLVKLGTTTAQKKLFFNLRKIRNQLNLIDDKEVDHITIAKIASLLSVKPSEIKEMNNRMYNHDTSLNLMLNNDGGDGVEFIDLLADKIPNQEERLINKQTYAYRKKLFQDAIGVLNFREKDILFKRRLCSTPQTLDNLSCDYGISKERVRQIELNSIKKIRNNIFALQ
jgi:RNA polymerase sigma-32 factor